MSSSVSVRVEKATSDLLIGPDWTMNLEICDSINSDQWHAKDVVKAVKKRLQNKNPKVQLLALTLLETLIKNCGQFVHLQVVERNILQEMVKIVKKKTDMEVRDKILVLLDSWQEAFGGPGGKYPQYFLAYDELRRSGVEFPQRSGNTVPVFTPPVTHPIARHPQTGYGMPPDASRRLDEAMASEMQGLSLSNMDAIRSVMELLADMLQAVNPNDRNAVKDEVIVDLVSQCRSNKGRLMQLLNSTLDEELLGRGLALNDNLQSLLAKHDAIASGSPLPSEPVASSSTRISTPAPLATARGEKDDEDEDDEDDDFAQLARRPSKAWPVPSHGLSGETSNKFDSAQLNDPSVTTSNTTNAAATSTSTTTNTNSIFSGPLALPEPPQPVRTTTKALDMIDLLSNTLATSSSPHTPLTPHIPLTPPHVGPTSPSFTTNQPHTPMGPMSPSLTTKQRHTHAGPMSRSLSTNQPQTPRTPTGPTSPSLTTNQPHTPFSPPTPSGPASSSSTSHRPPYTNHADPSSHQSSITPNAQGYPYNPTPYLNHQGQVQVPYNTYVAPWAQQPRFTQSPIQNPSSVYPPPPWATANLGSGAPIQQNPYQFPVSQSNPTTTYSPQKASPTSLQQNYSFGSRVNNATPSLGGEASNVQRQAPQRSFISADHYFEGLIDLKGAKGSSTSPKMNREGTLGGRK
ncbi:ADP-ribosylation factor-binding protein GGA2 isoform X2 [Amborella trichopoda]|uniref:VHS domain-containing protein n=1 Tax=Amborella trichopoda TaxID=13333 RepID=W1PE90_AMBTC|nr:ADP-ribosylation factor-binding protein GGA2 isoform X2 [Amborella trichopoda]ERN05370.1 hypothetical protein AMTR_s00007p00204170 [Amborella trichopoda]|eukprot:XP_006843695.1 ADP-ribosylation factor-binding protein GGA2 isoform X2 [Amborella trichopoda]